MSNKSIWPESDWEHFPETRIGALVIDAVAVVIVVIGLIIPRRFYRVTSGIGVTCCCFKRWGFWICGRDIVSIENEHLVITQDRCCCGCGTAGTFMLRSDDILSISLVHRPILFAGVAWAFGTSCLIGIWLHFIPCIWWTCDWGPHDGQGVRGGIWFVMWAVMFVVLCFLTRTIAVEIKCKNKVQCHLVSVGGGNTYNLEDTECCRVLEEIRTFVNVKDTGDA